MNYFIIICVFDEKYKLKKFLDDFTEDGNNMLACDSSKIKGFSGHQHELKAIGISQY